MSSSATSGAAASDRRSHLRSAIGWVVSIACLALIAWKVDLGAAIAALRDFDWRYIPLGLGSLAFGYTMRIIRWRNMLHATGASVTVSQCAAPFLGSIALNNVLPLRVGDIVRATVFPASIGVPRTAAIGSIVMERLLDLLTLLLCLAIGATALGTATLPAWLTDGAIVLASIGTIALFGIFSLSGLLSRLVARLAAARPPEALETRLLTAGVNLLNGFRQMSGPWVLVGVFVLSMLAWVSESGVFWSVMAGFGLHTGPLAVLLVMAFVTLSTLVPSSPGYVGPFHLAAISVVVLLGVREEVATSFAVLVHLMLWVPTTLAGGIAMLARPEIFRGAMRKRPQAAT